MNLTLKIVNQFFHMAHHLVTIHHHIKFGKKWLSSSGDTERTRSDTWTGLQKDKVIPIYHSPLFIQRAGGEGGGGGIKTPNNTEEWLLNNSSFRVLINARLF